MYYKIAQLSLTSSQKAATTSEIFIAQPDADKEQLVGKLFILAEIESDKANPEYSGLKIINFLINSLNQNYYQNEKIILREKISALKPEHIFESALGKTNKNLTEFLESEKIKINPGAANITAGIIYKNELHFANIGKNKALLIYKEPMKAKSRGDERQAPSLDEKKYKITDIARQKETAGEKPADLAKLFTNVISGQIPPGGYFIFANEALPEYLSGKQLTEIVTTLPPAGAVEQIKNTLVKINAYVSFLGIIIKNTFGEEAPELSYKITRAASQASVENLSATEQTTEKLLTPSGIIDFKKWLDFLPALFKKFTARGRRESKPILLKDKIFIKKRSGFLSIKKYWQILKNIFAVIANSFLYLIKLLSSKEKITSQAQLIAQKAGETTNSFAVWFKNLKIKRKIALIVFAACVLLLIQNLALTSLKNKKAENEKIYDGLTETIKRKQSQIEASLLYKNEESAKNLLDEVENLITQFPQETEQQKEQYDDFLNKLREQMETIRRVVKIGPLNGLADFANLNSGAEPDNLIFINKIIYAGDSKQKSIYSLDISDNSITAIADTGQSINGLRYPTADKNNNIYYFNLDSIVKLETESREITNLTADFKNNRQAADIDAYNGRLYLLDRQNSQIYRYNIAKNSLTGAQAWLNEKADFADAVNMAIDGSIYVLKNNGQLLKYLKGRGQEFKLGEVEPKLENPSKLIVSPELKYIYILESSNKRLVVFDKAGVFLTQYQSDQFNDLKDFAVDEINKKIYFLDKTSVYGIEAKHFE
ncbi:hypothetical protein KKC04_00150 [Patescibacteria group bacterium]|nr:hypothetical protein [Patescibacteria group bacterium]